MVSGSPKEKADLTQLMPQSIEAEEAVLGAILVNPRSLDKVMTSLRPEYFYKPAHRYIYEAMLQLTNNNTVIDIVSVSDTLNFNQKLELVGGRAYINDLSFKCISTANVKYYTDIIEEKAIKRSLINAGTEITTTGYDTCSSDESLEKAERLIFDLSSKKSTSELVPIENIIYGTYDMINERYKNRDKKTGVESGFYDLDELTNGFQKSDLIILAARPAMGKTAFALNIAQNAALRNGKTVAIFSLEMSKDQLVQRLLCSEAEVDSQRLRSGNMQSTDWEKLANAMANLAETNIYIDDSSACTLNDIRAKCRRLAMQEKELSLIVIDYLQLIMPAGKMLSLQQHVAEVSRGLKLLAKELNVPIITLSQLSRGPEQRNDKRPQLADLRDSGSIEQDADIVMFIYRGEYYVNNGEASEEEALELAKSKGEAEIIIAKQRSGPTGTVKLLFQNNITKFKNKTKVTTEF
ncbi:MAG: replicative DNA helicase [Cyanobacteria bacterium RUI128]|nr:replicative DNA helicase [Cyanobacteria bacterium RUI128]